MPEELGINMNFTNLTEDQCLEKIDPDSLGEGKEYILMARKATFDLFKEMYGPYNRLKAQKDIDIFTRDNGKDGQSVLGVGEIPFGIDEVAEILLDDKQRKNFDEMLDEGTIMNEYDHMTFVIYITFKRIMILSPRDFML